ncbi:MAG: tetratricopeptide repeat protein [Elusimicrobia bacterium]|nr:tetratricopeptide repeat protein [Elusimicrobiota bacterium]
MGPHTRHPHEKPHHPHWPLALLLFSFVLFLGLFSVHESLTWLHIKSGADIISSGTIARADQYSYTMNGRPWSTDSWLADVLFYLVHTHIGPEGLMALKALAVALAFALLLPINPGNPLLAAAVLALGAMAIWAGYTERPAVLDLPLLALLIRILRPRAAFDWKVLLKVGGLIALWANLHGPAASIGVWIVGLKAFKASLRTPERERLDFLFLFLASVLALSLNPHGLAVFTRIFASLDSSWLSWHSLSPWFNGYILFAAAGIAACWICLQQEFILTMTAASLLVLSFVIKELRPAYVLAACPLITLGLGHFFPARTDTPLRTLRWAAFMGCLAVLHWTGVYGPLSRWRGYGPVALDGAAHFIRANSLKGKAFNEPEMGAPLAYLAGRPVFIDERMALYGPDFMKDALNWPVTFPQMAEIYGFDYAVVRNRRSRYPARVVDEDLGWGLAYADDQALIYVRRKGRGLQAAERRNILTPNRLWPDSLDRALADAAQRAAVLAELDRWIVQSPDSVQPLIWKAYAWEILGLSHKADRLLELARAHSRTAHDPEIMASLAFVLDRKGMAAQARRLYLKASHLAQRRADHALEAELAARLAKLYRKAGESAQARSLEKRAQELAALPAGSALPFGPDI